MTITSNLQLTLTNYKALEAVMQLVAKHQETLTSKIEDEVAKLHTSMNQQNENMLSMQKFIMYNIEEGITSLEDKVTDLEQEFCDLNVAGEEPLEPLQGNRNALFNDKYERLNSIEINGIPVMNDDEDLASTICDILQQIGVTVNLTDFEVCYRLKEPMVHHSGHIPTICRFSNRKICRTAHRFKRNLRNVKIKGIDSNELYINDYLCWYYKKLAAKCRRLKKNRDISDTWTFKGIVKIRLVDGSVRSIKHQIDLDKLFPNYVYFE